MYMKVYPAPHEAEEHSQKLRGQSQRGGGERECGISKNVFARVMSVGSLQSLQLPRKRFCVGGRETTHMAILHKLCAGMSVVPLSHAK